MIPFLGTISAGFPTEAEEDVLDTMSLDEFVIGNKDATYMLRMRGESMASVGILDGDLIVVERAAEARAGDIVITVKDGGYAIGFLNSSMRGSQVEAVVKAVVRKYR